MAATPHICDFGAAVPDFALPDTNGRLIRRDDIVGKRGTLVMFICNHCPYVITALDRLLTDARELINLDIGVVAISANDITTHPQDAPDKMAALARDRAFPFPYLYDETQDVARAFGAVCTPDFFGYNANGGLQYRGQLDAGRPNAIPADMRRDLFLGMKQIAETGIGPRDQVPSMGCSIKWKA